MYWDVVERIVKQRGKQLQKYKFFEEVWEALDSGSQLIVVRAPTGCGKTEAVTAPFLKGVLTGSRKWFSLIHALPSKSLVEALRRRMCKSLKSIGVTRATITSNYGELLASKPYLEGDVAVTTYDTLLYAFYGIIRPGYHVLLPLSKLIGSLLVLDEVQLLQDAYWYSMSLMPAHVSSLIELGSQVVIMSATIPEAVLSEVERKVKGINRPVKIVSEDKPSRGKLTVELKEGILPQDEDIEKLILDYIVECENLPALIVVNTVEKAVNIYKRLIRLKADGRLRDAEPLMLHSRLTRGTRERVEGIFESEDSSGGLSKVILVATQVIEAGLDMDLRFLLTELSPIDSLVQRLGRVARRSDAEAIIFLDPSGGRNVYPETLLKRTLETVKGDENFLADCVSNIQVVQALVDKVYTADVIQSLSEGKENIISEINNLIHKFSQMLYSADIREILSTAPLLRLSYEMQCLYLAGGAYTQLMEFKPLNLDM
ncbi:MAG: CRISPR-associated helicase Cas3', partial [Thermofilaceae archaeon]